MSLLIQFLAVNSIDDVSPAGKLDLAIEISSRCYQINNMLKNPFLEEFLLVGRRVPLKTVPSGLAYK